MFQFLVAFLNNWPVLLFAVLSAAVYYAKRNHQQHGEASSARRHQWNSRPATAPVHKVKPQPSAVVGSIFSPAIRRGIFDDSVCDSGFSSASLCADGARSDVKAHPCKDESPSQSWPTDASRLPVPSSKNLLNKKEGVGIIKESTESSQTIEEQDGDVKSSGGNNLKHENTVVHVDTAAMAAAAVATAGVGIGASSVTSPSPLTTPTTPGLPPSAKKQEIVKLTESLIEAITSSDYATYSKLCDANVTCFEPESLGNLIEGLEFHKFYFDNPPKAGTSNSLKNVRSSLLNPHVHLLGDDSACIAYVRLTQWVNRNGIALSQRCEETRIWQKRDGKWHCVHFHRSSTSSSVYAPSCEDAGISGMIRNTPC